MSATVYDFKVFSADGKPYDLHQHEGKVILIVNVASRCGFTPQYTQLETLYKQYSSDGLVVLGFPCNQFGAQEPGTEEEIQAFCKTEFDVTFPILSKIEVNGKSSHPLFVYLKDQAPGLAGTKSIKWNFTKFLVDRGGKVAKRFSPMTKPEKMDVAIIGLLEKPF